MGALHWEFRSDEDLSERVHRTSQDRERTPIRMRDCLRSACALVVITSSPISCSRRVAPVPVPRPPRPVSPKPLPPFASSSAAA
jgi:hypothetical protein